MKNNTNAEELILEIGAEGGSINIYRFRTPDGSWKFFLVTDESTMADFLDEDDKTELVRKYPPVDTFEEAIHLMNKFPWRELQIISVHPEYAETLQKEKQNLKY